MIQKIAKTKVVAVEISKLVTTYAIVDLRGNILARESFNTEEYPDINRFVAKLCESIVLMVENNCGMEEIRSVGVSAPSGNFITGCIMNSPNMSWKGVIPLAAMMRDQLGIAVALGNNSHGMALSERAFGSGHGYNHIVVVTMGHGLGCTLVSEGKVVLGAHGFMGEFGHTIVEEGGRQCGCGNRGCLERYVAAPGIVATAQELLAASDKPSLMRGEQNLSPRIISHCCELGDELALDTYRNMGGYLGRGLATMCATFDPEAIILTGGIAAASPWFFDSMKSEFDKHIFPNMRGHIALIISDMAKSERELLGASMLAWQVKEYSLFK